MGLSIVCGGQWGSEGKGKTTYFFAKKLHASSVIRVGGPNSGHTVITDSGKKYIFQMLPVASVIDETTCVLPAGTYIDMDILQHEISLSGLPENRLKIHPNAVILDKTMKVMEQESSLKEMIGSTQSGTGAGVLSRVSRKGNVTLAQDIKELKKYICDTSEFLREELRQNKELIIEGTQGFGLSLLYTPKYPYATSRDTSAAGFLSEAGLSPFDVTNVILVLRAFPIRVAGNSGPLPMETSWQDVTKFAQAEHPLVENTTVTQRIRRVAKFDSTIIKKAIVTNKPNIVVLNHCDYFDYSINNKEYLSEAAEKYVESIEKSIGKIDYIGTGDRTLFER